MQQPLVELFRRKEVNSFPRVASAAAAIVAADLGALFEEQRLCAPRRGNTSNYFVGHNGVTTSGLPSNRREEHLAIALWRAYRSSGFEFQDGVRLSPLDYQVPLKSHRDPANAGVGKVDLLCASDLGQPWVIELKVHPACVLRPVETPLKALLEALAYTAILDANLESLCEQSRSKCTNLAVAARPIRPHLMVLAPLEYWALCQTYEERFPAREQMSALRRRIRETLGVQSKFVAMHGCQWNAPADGCGPSMICEPRFQLVDDDA